MAADTYNDHPARLQPEICRSPEPYSYKPKFLLINWSKGSVAGCGTEDECREQLEKRTKGSTGPDDSYIIAAVKVLSELRRIET